MPYKINGSLSQPMDLTVLDLDGNLLARQNLSAGPYEITGLTAPSGIIFGTTSDDNFKGFGKVPFINYQDSYTKLLLHFNESPLVDTMGKTLTLNGGVARSATQSKFGGYSEYFDGVNDYISIPDSEDWNFGSGDFTIDLWINFSSLTGIKSILGQDEGPGDTNKWVFIYNYPSVNKITFTRWHGESGSDYSWDLSPVINTWYHIAIVRSGNILSCYIDGIKLSSDKDVTGASWPQVNSPLTVGTEGENYAWMNGYIDELRISKGIARWTSNFTPPVYAY